MIQRRLKHSELSDELRAYVKSYPDTRYWSDTVWNLRDLDKAREQYPKDEYRVVTVVKDEKRSHKKKVKVG